MNSHRKAEKVRLCDYNPGGCGKLKSVQYNIPIEVPSVPPTDLTSSSVCRVKYELQVSKKKDSYEKLLLINRNFYFSKSVYAMYSVYFEIAYCLHFQQTLFIYTSNKNFMKSIKWCAILLY